MHVLDLSHHKAPGHALGYLWKVPMLFPFLKRLIQKRHSYTEIYIRIAWGQ